MTSHLQWDTAVITPILNASDGTAHVTRRLNREQARLATLRTKMQQNRSSLLHHPVATATSMGMTFLTVVILLGLAGYLLKRQGCPSACPNVLTCFRARTHPSRLDSAPTHRREAPPSYDLAQDTVPLAASPPPQRSRASPSRPSNPVPRSVTCF